MNINKMKKKVLVLTMATIIASPITTFATNWIPPTRDIYNEDKYAHKVYPKAEEYPDNRPIFIPEVGGGSIGTHTVHNRNILPYNIDREKNNIRFSEAKPLAHYHAVSSNNNIVKPTGFKVTIPGPENDFTKHLGLPLGQVFFEGVNVGEATLTIYETYKGKTKELGKTKVTIKDSQLSAWGNYTHDYGLGRQLSYLEFINRVEGEEYSFEVDKEGLTIEQDIVDYEANSKNKIIIFNADKVGTYKVTAYKTKNNVKTKMKTINVKIHDVEITQKAEYRIDEIKSVMEVFSKYFNLYYDIHIEIDGVDSIYIPLSDHDSSEVDTWTKSSVAVVRNLVSGVKPGKVNVKVYRIPIGDYDNHYNETELEKEYLGTTELTILPAKPKAK